MEAITEVWTCDDDHDYRPNHEAVENGKVGVWCPREKRLSILSNRLLAVGSIDHAYSAFGEMSVSAVVVDGPPGQHQEFTQQLADRAAITLRALGRDDCDGACNPVIPERFHALLDGLRGCAFCGQPLRHDLSKRIGVGRNCARAWRIPWTEEAAQRRAQLRQQIFGEAV